MRQNDREGATVPSRHSLSNRLIQRLPPSTLYLIAVAAITLGYFVLITTTPAITMLISGILIAIAGMAIAIYHDQIIVSGAGKSKLFKQPDKLIQSGLFSISRNPVYLGYAISLMGWGLAFNSVLGWLALSAFIITTDQWYIPLEERALQLAFGDEYTRYCEQTSRWFTVSTGQLSR